MKELLGNRRKEIKAEREQHTEQFAYFNLPNLVTDNLNLFWLSVDLNDLKLFKIRSFSFHIRDF